MSDERKIPAAEDFGDIGKRLQELREEKERIRRINALPEITAQDVESALSIPGIWVVVDERPPHPFPGWEAISEKDYPGIFG